MQERPSWADSKSSHLGTDDCVNMVAQGSAGTAKPSLEAGPAQVISACKPTAKHEASLGLLRGAGANVSWCKEIFICSTGLPSPDWFYFTMS